MSPPSPVAAAGGNPRLVLGLGLLLLVAGAWCCWDAERHGLKLPWPLSGLMPY